MRTAATTAVNCLHPNGGDARTVTCDPVIRARGAFGALGRLAMLGLKHGINALADPDPDWSRAFMEERARIHAAIGTVVRGIEHYGSTAVDGLKAKPILDILVGVAVLEDWIKCRLPLETLGYDYAEHAGVPGHHIFGRGRDRSERTHLVHVVEFNGEPWRSNLAFRDALRADATLRAEYLRMKVHALTLAPESRAKYNALKHAFIEGVKERLARAK
jgi:GrpB-like predicted nucleotidyltransferase (UPF0157 family)